MLFFLFHFLLLCIFSWDLTFVISNEIFNVKIIGFRLVILKYNVTLGSVEEIRIRIILIWSKMKITESNSLRTNIVIKEPDPS